jgi:hypothetical protein
MIQVGEFLGDSGIAPQTEASLLEMDNLAESWECSGEESYNSPTDRYKDNNTHKTCYRRATSCSDLETQASCEGAVEILKKTNGPQPDYKRGPIVWEYNLTWSFLWSTYYNDNESVSVDPHLARTERKTVAAKCVWNENLVPSPEVQKAGAFGFSQTLHQCDTRKFGPVEEKEVLLSTKPEKIKSTTTFFAGLRGIPQSYMIDGGGAPAPTPSVKPMIDQYPRHWISATLAADRQESFWGRMSHLFGMDSAYESI